MQNCYSSAEIRYFFLYSFCGWRKYAVSLFATSQTRRTLPVMVGRTNRQQSK